MDKIHVKKEKMEKMEKFHVILEPYIVTKYLPV
jgi:hypothetical protein